MLRQARRKELRETADETRKIWKNSPLKKIMQSKPFNDLTMEDIEVLEKGQFPDEKMQADYQLVTQIMLRLRELQERSVELQSK